MAGYEAVCFDLDSTLCEPTQSREQLLESTFERAGVVPFCTPSGLRSAAAAVPTAETDFDFFRLLFAEAGERAGMDPETATDIAPSLATSYLEILNPSAVCFRPGARHALEYARERGPVGLITNGSREIQTQKLEALDLLDSFDVAVFTDPEAGVPPKPDSIPFERALSGLASDPASTVHIGDSLHADIAGANAMGMDSIWVDTGVSTPGTYEPTYEVRSLEELPELL